MPLRRLALASLVMTAVSSLAAAQDTPVAVAAAPAETPAPAPRLHATLVTHAAAGKQPTTCAIAPDGSVLWVTNRGDNSVSVFETAGMTLERTIVEVGYSAWGILPRSETQLLVANWAGSSIALVDAKSGKRLGELPVGMKPSYLALSPDGKRVYSAGNFSEDVSITDVASKKPVRTIPVGRRPMGVALSKDGGSLWVAACDSKKIVRVDAANGVLAGTFDAPLASTTNLVLTPDGSRLLAAGEGGSLVVVSTATGAVESLPVGGDSSSVAVTPSGRVALVADYRGASVALVDLADMKRYETVPVGEGAIHVETDGRRFYTCNDKAASVSVYRLDPIEPEAAPSP